MDFLVSVLGGGRQQLASKFNVGHPQDPVVASWFGGADNHAGVEVTHETATAIPAVFRAISLISNARAMLPQAFYERKSDRRERLRQHRLDMVINDQPNTEMDGYTFKRVMQANVMGYGNAVAEKVMNGFGETEQLWPLDPLRVRPMRLKSGQKAFEVWRENGRSDVLDASQILHIPDHTDAENEWGISRIRKCAEAIGLARAMEIQASAFFGNGARPGGALVYERPLTPTQRSEIKESWNAIHQGPSNSHKVAVFGGNPKWEAFGIDPVDAQLLEERNFSVNEIARIFDVQPHMLFELTRSSFNNIEQQSLEFFTTTLQPWLELWERRCNFSLLTTAEKKRHFYEHIPEALLKVDFETRQKSYAIGRQWGWFSINDVRKMENLPPVDNGDDYLQPVNMQPVGQEPPEPAAPPAPPEPKDDESMAKRMVAIYAIARAEATGIEGGDKALSVFQDELQVLKRDVDGWKTRLDGKLDAIEQSVSGARERFDAVIESERQASEKRISAAREAALQSINHIYTKLMERECREAIRAARSGDNMSVWLDEFYGKHAARFSDVIRRPLAVLMRLDEDDRDVSDVLAELTRNHCDRSRGEILEVMGAATRENLELLINRCVSSWGDRTCFEENRNVDD